MSFGGCRLSSRSVCVGCARCALRWGAARAKICAIGQRRHLLNIKVASVNRTSHKQTNSHDTFCASVCVCVTICVFTRHVISAALQQRTTGVGCRAPAEAAAFCGERSIRNKELKYSTSGCSCPGNAAITSRIRRTEIKIQKPRKECACQR